MPLIYPSTNCPMLLRRTKRTNEIADLPNTEGSRIEEIQDDDISSFCRVEVIEPPSFVRLEPVCGVRYAAAIADRRGRAHGPAVNVEMALTAPGKLLAKYADANNTIEFNGYL